MSTIWPEPQSHSLASTPHHALPTPAAPFGIWPCQRLTVLPRSLRRIRPRLSIMRARGWHRQCLPLRLLNAWCPHVTVQHRRTQVLYRLNLAEKLKAPWRRGKRPDPVSAAAREAQRDEREHPAAPLGFTIKVMLLGMQGEMRWMDAPTRDARCARTCTMVFCGCGCGCAARDTLPARLWGRGVSGPSPVPAPQLQLQPATSW